MSVKRLLLLLLLLAVIGTGAVVAVKMRNGGTAGIEVDTEFFGKVFQIIKNQRVTEFFLPPTVIYRLLSNLSPAKRKLAKLLKAVPLPPYCLSTSNPQ